MSVNFLDTNIFIYLFDEVDEEKRNISTQLVQNALKTGQGRISFQVVQETLNVITQKLETPVTSADARRFLDSVLIPLWRIYPNPNLYRHCIEIQNRYQFSFYDSLVIAAALRSGSTLLYSEDMQHGQQIEGLTINNPFVSIR